MQVEPRYNSIFKRFTTTELRVRELEKSDYEKGNRSHACNTLGYFELLNSFFKAPKPTQEEFNSIL